MSARAIETVGLTKIYGDTRALDDLDQWCARLDTLGVRHSAPAQGHLGWYIEVPDPDGIIVELHTIEQPTADEA